jgi:hypothetical protein
MTRPVQTILDQRRLAEAFPECSFPPILGQVAELLTSQKSATLFVSTGFREFPPFVTGYSYSVDTTVRRAVYLLAAG